jgi:hypothetical protein
MSGETKSPVLCLVEWNTGGHHETYLKIYAEALLRLGWRLVILCRRGEELRQRLAEPAWRGALEIVEIPEPGRYARAGRGPGGFALWRWARALKAARDKGEAIMGRAHRVHFLCLYEHQVRMIMAATRALGSRWTGLYLQAHAIHRPGQRVPGGQRDWPVSRLWREGRPEGLLMLDESAADAVRAHTGVPVALAPDFTAVELRDGDALADQAKAFAAGRPLVGLLGHLLPSKGVGNLARAALGAEAGDHGPAYLLAGEVHWELFDAEETALLRRMQAGEGGAWVHAARIPDEAGYNALVSACDVLCATYRDFPHSSNTLAKAAFFEKPIIVSDGHLMARRVREHRMGEVVPQDDPAALRAALRRVTEDPAGWRAAARPDWAGYRDKHSVARLEEALERFFGGLCPSGGAPGGRPAPGRE